MRAKQITYSLLFFLCLFLSPFSSAQQVIISDSENYTATSNNALLEVHSQSRDKGILIPRVSTSQREAIDTNPFSDEGLLVYDLQSKSFWFWKGDKWQELGAANNPGSFISDADSDTKIYVEKNPDEDVIRLEVDTFAIALIDTNGVHIKGDLELMHGTIINEISNKAAINISDSTIVTAGAIRQFSDYRTYTSVKEYDVKGDGVSDDSEALQKAIMDNADGTLFMPDGIYIANISVDTPITLISHTGNVVFKSNKAGMPTLSVNADLNLYNLSFEHSDSTSDGSDGLWNNDYNIKAINCTFIGHELNATGNTSHSEFRNCTFTTRDAGLTSPPSFGTIAWSANSVFTNCLFNGTFGADAQDSKFFHCTFDAQWGVHMPDGKTNNSGTASGFEGNAEFHHCLIKGTMFYAIGLGNDAHPKLYNCTVIGHASSAYARTQSTYEAYNCFFKATKGFGGSSTLIMSKWPTATHSGIGLVASGDSYFSNCTFTGGQFDLNIPDRSDAGRLYFSNCSYDLNKIYVDQQTAGEGDKDKYLIDKTTQTAAQEMGITIEKALNVSADGLLDFHLPKGYKITSIVLQERNGHSVSNIQLGTSANGNQIATPMAVAANDLMDAPVVKALFSLTSNTSIYVSSDNWGSGAIDIYIKMEKVN